MPKTWDKSYQWILGHKTKLEDNYRNILKIADEVEKQQNNVLKEINFKIDECKKPVDKST